MISETERAAIESAVRSAETGISGEIVPCIVDSSDEYSSARWKAGATVASLAWVALFFAETYAPALVPLDPVFAFALIPLLAALLGVIAIRFPSVRRFFVSAEEAERCVRRRAKEAFLDHSVFRTRERTGVLLFVSLFEHRVVVLGDEGINAKVRTSDWDAIVASILSGIRAGALSQGLIEGIRLSRELLLRHGYIARSDDQNEIDDRPRT